MGERRITLDADYYDSLLIDAMDGVRLKDMIIERYHQNKGITAEEVRCLYEMYFNLPKAPDGAEE